MAGQHLAVVTDRVFSPKTRLWLYGVVIAALAILVGYGIVDQGHAGLWLTLAAAVLGLGSTGLAAANVPRTVQTPAAAPLNVAASPGSPAVATGPGTVAQSDTTAGNGTASGA